MSHQFQARAPRPAGFDMSKGDCVGAYDVELV